jgi:hypothetical protein
MTEIPRSNTSFVDPLSQWDAEVTKDEESDPISPIIPAKPPTNQRAFLSSSSSVISKPQDAIPAVKSSEIISITETAPRLIRSHTISSVNPRETKHSRHLSFNFGNGNFRSFISNRVKRSALA